MSSQRLGENRRRPKEASIRIGDENPQVHRTGARNSFNGASATIENTSGTGVLVDNEICRIPYIGSIRQLQLSGKAFTEKSIRSAHRSPKIEKVESSLSIGTQSNYCLLHFVL